MQLLVTPYTQTQKGFMLRVQNRHSLLALPSALGCARHHAMEQDCYDKRQTHDLVVEDEEQALHVVWSLYQNIDANRGTPDGKQSMQTGDVVHIETNDTWWLCCSFGWDEIEKPSWA